MKKPELLSFSRNLTKILKEEKLDKLSLACSGGIDSMALLRLLLRENSRHFVQNSKNLFALDVVYIDHAQRVDTKKEIQIIKKFCTKNKVKFYSYKLKVPQLSCENLLREHRYKTLFDHCHAVKSALITAHHADDDLETKFYKLIRGTHPASLKGIASVSSRNDVIIVRPLLSFSKKAIRDYAMECKIKWREDSTNMNSKFSRNRIRNIIFPELEKAHPGAIRNLSRFLNEIPKEKRARTSHKSNLDHLDAVHGIEIKNLNFAALKDYIDQQLSAFASKTTRSQWETLKFHLNTRQAHPKCLGEVKTVQFPGGYSLLFKRNFLFWRAPR